MEKLELKHLAAYLPYNLKCTNSKENYLQTGEDRTGILETLSLKEDDTVIMGNNGYFLVSYYQVVPILRPLSDLEEKIFIETESEFDFIPVEQFDKLIDGWCDAYDEWWNLQYPNFLEMMDNCPREVFDKFLEWHFDVFGLIEKGIAVDINTLK